MWLNKTTHTHTARHAQLVMVHRQSQGPARWLQHVQSHLQCTRQHTVYGTRLRPMEMLGFRLIPYVSGQQQRQPGVCARQATAVLPCRTAPCVFARCCGVLQAAMLLLCAPTVQCPRVYS
jgi:hypothetical protein